MKIFIVIPLFNEVKHIGSVLKDVLSYHLPIVVVDDGSRDKSGEIVKGLKSNRITLISHKVNLGKGAAMKTGADFAFSSGAEAVIFMDADGQHLAADIPKFVKALSDGKSEVIFGSRNLSMGVPLVRYLGNKVASVVSAYMFGAYISDAVCGFRALTRRGYEKIKWESKGYGVEMEMVARTGRFKVPHMEVPVETVYHDHVKGVTLLDAFGILGEVVKWGIKL